MSTVGVATTLATGALWRVTGAAGLGRTLTKRASRGDEDEATVAMMMLTNRGDRAIPIVSSAVAAGDTELVDVLVSIGTTAARTALARLADDPSDDVRAPAAAALAELDRIRTHERP